MECIARSNDPIVIDINRIAGILPRRLRLDDSQRKAVNNLFAFGCDSCQRQRDVRFSRAIQGRLIRQP